MSEKISDDNPKQIDEVERTKWFISRIDLYHKISLESIENSKRIFENIGAETLSKLKTRKKEIFTVLGVILTVVLGINSFSDVPEWIFYLSLSLVSGASVIVYKIFSYAENMIDESFTFLGNLVVDERMILAQSQIFVASGFADLALIELNTVKNYGVFSVLLEIALIVDMMNRLKDYRTEKSKWLVDLFDSEFSKVEEIKKDAPDLLKKFVTDDPYPELGYELIKKMLMNDSKKQHL